MVMYSESMMLSDLLARVQSGQIPNKWDKEFILSRADNSEQFAATMAQYNKLLDLYNKYIVVAASHKQSLRANNYG